MVEGEISDLTKNINTHITVILGNANSFWPQFEGIGVDNHDYKSGEYLPASIKAARLLIEKSIRFSELDTYQVDIEKAIDQTNKFHESYNIPVTFSLENSEDTGRIANIYNSIHQDVFQVVLLRLKVLARSKYKQFIAEADKLKTGAEIDGFLNSHSDIKEDLVQRLNDEFEIFAPDASPRREGFRGQESVSTFGQVLNMRIDSQKYISLYQAHKTKFIDPDNKILNS